MNHKLKTLGILVGITIVVLGIGVAAMLKQAGLTSSTSESFRMIQQGAVKIDGEKVSDRGLELERGSVFVAQVGKRKFARVTLS